MSENETVKKVELGRALAEAYIAAQGVSQEASLKVCEAVEVAERWVKWGFDQRMANSPFHVRALVRDHRTYSDVTLPEVIPTTVGAIMDYLRVYPRSTKVVGITTEGHLSGMICFQPAHVDDKVSLLCVTQDHALAKDDLALGYVEGHDDNWLVTSYRNKGHRAAAAKFLQMQDYEMTCPLENLDLNSPNLSTNVFERYLRRCKLIPDTPQVALFERVMIGPWANKEDWHLHICGDGTKAPDWSVRVWFTNKQGEHDSFDILADRT